MSATCPHCRGSEIEYDAAAGNSVCIGCGAVVEESAVVAEVSFAELANGSSVLEGQFISADRGKTSLPTIFGRRVGDIGGRSSADGPSMESREATLANGKRRIQALAGAVGLSGEHYIDAAHRWYALALQHQFTRGRKGPNVIAACVYIVCRQERTPHMLLDFSDVLAVSVYSLGGTFLRLCRLLNLEMPIVDPSFFVARFAAKLEFGEKTNSVSNTALRVVARMKRDWIQVGRRPAGVCAAGLIIAARMHGFRRTEAEVVRVVRICEQTLKARLEEFGRTASSKLTPQEFEGIWLEQEADPPCFRHTRSKPAEEGTIHILPTTLEHLHKIKGSSETEGLTYPFTPADSQASTPESEDDHSTQYSLSDVEVDDEMASIILDEVEVALKTRIWTEINRDYLDKVAEKERLEAIKAQESAAKDTAEAEVKQHKEGYEPNFVDPLANEAAFAPPKTVSKKGRRPKSTSVAAVSKKATPPVASSAAEAAKQVLQGKRLSKKINYKALDDLFASTEASLR